MKMKAKAKSLSLSASIIGMLLVAGATAFAEPTYHQIVNELNAGSPSDWTGNIWSSGAAAASGNDYLTEAIVGTNCGIRTPNVTANFAFAGDQLYLTNLGCLLMKHASCTATANIILDGGQIIFHGATGTGPCGLAGTLQINLNTNMIGRTSSDSGTQFYNLGEDQGGNNSRNIAVYSDLSGPGNLILNTGTSAGDNGNNIVQIWGTNTLFSGNWTNNNGTTLSAEGACVNPFGLGGTIVIIPGTTLRFNQTNNLVISNTIYGGGEVLQANTGVTALVNTNDYYTGSTVVSAGVLQIGAGVILSSPTISLAGGTLDETANGGLVLNVASNQQMNCNGSIKGSLTAQSFSGGQTNNLNFSASFSGHSVLNVSGALILSNNPTLTLSVSGLVPNGTYTLINYSGAIQGGGSFNLIAPGGESFTLNTNAPGLVNLVVSGAVVQNVTWVGDGVNNNWDLTSANWTGQSTIFGQGDNVTFNDNGSTSPPINFVTNVYPSSMLISNSAEYYTFGNSGSTVGLILAGSFTKEGTNEVDFATSSNDISGPITIQSGTLCVGSGLSPNAQGSLGTGSITNNGALLVDMDGGAVAFNSPIGGTGSFTIEDTASFINGTTVTIGGNNSYTGGTSISNQCELNVATSTALGSGSVIVNGGRLGVTADVGLMAVSNALSITGTGVASPNQGALYVGNAGDDVTWAGPVTILTSAEIRGVSNCRMNLSNIVTGVNANLEATAGNPSVIGGSDASTTIFFEGPVTLGSGQVTVDGVGTVIFDNPTNVWTGNTVVNSGTMRVGGTLNGGSVTIGTGAFSTLTGTGTILGQVTVASGSLFFPGSFSTPIGTLTVSNSVIFSSGSTNLYELNRAHSPNSSGLVATNIALDGTLNVVNVGVPLQAGDTFTLFSSSSISGSFAVTNLPTLSSPNLYWDTSLLGSQGIIKVGSSVVPQPVITSISVSGTTLTIAATNGLAEGPYVLLESTNLLTPVSQWTPVLTNNFNGSGNLNLSTNVINPGIPQEFYILSP